MKSFKSHFRFNRQERSGIFFLLVIIIILQAVYFSIKWSSSNNESSLQLNSSEQSKIDSLKMAANQLDSVKIYPFNPNFITDYKGYILGMTPEEIDRLHTFREQKRFVNSVEEFQKVTGVSDSLLNVLAPQFKFPDWVKNVKHKVSNSTSKSNPLTISVKDLNLASAEDLKAINGIGEKLSERIIKFRNRLGGFLVNEQLYDVYALDREVANRVLKRFQVINPPKIKKINVNTASVDELSGLVYLRRVVSEEIVSYRQDNGSFGSFDELAVVEGFPTENIESIKLYLSL